MPLAILLYVTIGLALASGMLCASRSRRTIDRIANLAGMSIGYGRMVWLGGTILTWPIGLLSWPPAVSS